MSSLFSNSKGFGMIIVLVLILLCVGAGMIVVWEGFEQGWWDLSTTKGSVTVTPPPLLPGQTQPPAQAGQTGTQTGAEPGTQPGTETQDGGPEGSSYGCSVPTCSNAKYSTVCDDGYVKLPYDQELAFNDDITARGNAALQDIADLTCLEELAIYWKSELTNLTAIKGLVNMRYLSLTDAGVSSVAPLKDMTRMQILNLGGTGVSDISVLSNMKYLRSVDLSRTQVSDITPLYGLPIEELYLSETQITSMPDITKFQNLRVLTVKWSALMMGSDEMAQECFDAFDMYYPGIDINCI